MTKVKSIRFISYKAFPDFSIFAKDRNVLVGPNNAGKSTVLDAFRIAFDALRYSKRRNAVLKSQGNDGVCSTWTVPISAIQTDLRYCVHNFGEGQSSIYIRLENGNSFVILMYNDSPIECYLKSELRPRRNTKFLQGQFPLN